MPQVMVNKSIGFRSTDKAIVYQCERGFIDAIWYCYRDCGLRCAHYAWLLASCPPHLVAFSPLRSAPLQATSHCGHQ